MNKRFWQAVRDADWEPAVGTACGGGSSLFIWHVLRSGVSGDETAAMHLLGMTLITVGWLCMALAVYLLCRSIKAKLAQ